PAVTQSVTRRLPTNRSTNLTSSFRNRLLPARAARGKDGSLLGSRGFGHSTWNNSMYRYPAARRPRPWIKHCQQRFNSGTSLGHKWERPSQLESLRRTEASARLDWGARSLASVLASFLRNVAAKLIKISILNTRSSMEHPTHPGLIS